MTRTAEDQARRYLRLFPRWVRDDRASEAVSLVLDQLPPGAARLPVRSRADLVHAGLRSRIRFTPPPRVWAEVLLAEARNRRGLVPDRWRPWLIDWLRSSTWRRTYTAVTVAAILAILLLLSPFTGWDDGTPSLALNLALWSVVLAFVQYGRAPRWRWLIAVRNGLIPSDLRSIPRDATTVGVVRPLLTDRGALPVALGVAATATVLLGANAAVSRHGAAGAGVPGVREVGVALATAGVVLFAVLVPSVRQIRSLSADRPPLPDPAVMVERVWNRPGRVAWFLGALFVTAAFAIEWISDGRTGALVLGCLTALAWVQVGAVVVGRRRLGRALGMWEVWPATGPQPFLLVREDVLDAEGLRGPLARQSRPPGRTA